ncbi:DMT family transporter [Herbaspirillum sp. YR522]|uniref:DMT family transporter n=1 Tax=Herbaspirillum sp. YR522 TaxID=1144342 RepID=UPI00026F5328|nr:DMT family transporter [Herbaspirillum sp. YR522]EJN09425.1 putative permease, DMT superfamily [Herbaspirillum sp. YR522]
MSFTPSRPAGYACLILSMSLVGAYVALSKPLVAALPLFLLAWLRFGIGAVAMLRWLKKPPGELALSSQSRWLLFLESFLGNFLFSICMITGVSMTSAVSAGVIMSAIPAVVALMSWIFLKERIGPRVWGAIACGVLGIGMLSLAKPPHAGVTAPHDAWIGNLFVMGAVLCEAAYAVIGKKLTSVLSPKRISAIINLWGLLLMTPMGVYLALHFDFVAVTLDIWALLLFYGLAASVWTVWLWMTGLKVVPAGRAGVFTVMLPISTAVVGVVVLGERLSWLQGAAFAVALAGMVLVTAPTRSTPTVN